MDLAARQSSDQDANRKESFVTISAISFASQSRFTHELTIVSTHLLMQRTVWERKTMETMLPALFFSEKTQKVTMMIEKRVLYIVIHRLRTSQHLIKQLNPLDILMGALLLNQAIYPASA
jgi:hypothetical protein